MRKSPPGFVKLDGSPSTDRHPAWRLERLVASARERLHLAVPPLPVTFDRGEFLHRLSGDEELFADVIRLFLEDCPQRLAAIQAALDAHNAEDVRTSAHALKGAAANLSARRLAEAAHALEQMGANRQLEASDAAFKLVSAEASELIELLGREIASSAD
jgi:HPt (histidine-containing phosphotransfer) domain-containing protein